MNIKIQSNGRNFSIPLTPYLSEMIYIVVNTIMEIDKNYN